MKENRFQSKLIQSIKERFPNAIVMKNDGSYIQGFPDITIFNGDRWATLECKRSLTASHQPNQDYYVSKMNEMSFSRFVCPENEEEVLNELQQALEP